MIYDHKQSTLDATVDDSSIEATVSVSLGLIVTQLVINALKHAFPGRHQGKILVDYRSEGGNWTLSGSDNGVGVAANATTAKPGRGTSIVEALANRLEAEIQISSANPGTTISVTHSATIAASNVNSVPADRAVQRLVSPALQSTPGRRPDCAPSRLR